MLLPGRSDISEESSSGMFRADALLVILSDHAALDSLYAHCYYSYYHHSYIILLSSATITVTVAFLLFL